jgi:UDPglucose 6-dehydrogenase
MKVTVVGTGYVGLVTAACLAEMGNHVLGLDVDAAKIERLRAGELPIHEPGLDGLVRRNAEAGRLAFTTDVSAAVAHGTLQFIGVGTPPGEDGSADMQYVLAAAGAIGAAMTDYKVIVNKSTVPVGTADRVRDVVRAALVARGLSTLPFAVVSNPEFLKEGAAVEDCMRPDRIVVGTEDERALLLLRALYLPFMRNHERMQVMDARSAELTKYAANAMLATRISFMNELALLAERVGADIEQVRRGIGSDPRIGTHFLYAGAGYGGSCFPKDVQALRHTAREAGARLGVLDAVQAANQRQKQVLADKLIARFGSDLTGRRFALWGLAFKPETDDMREAPSLDLVAALLERGAELRAYDPVARTTAAAALAERLRTLPLAARARLVLVDSAAAVLPQADALICITEWREFRTPDFEHIKAELRQPLLFDGRNLWDPALTASLGFEHHAIGRGAQPQQRVPVRPVPEPVGDVDLTATAGLAAATA